MGKENRHLPRRGPLAHPKAALAPPPRHPWSRPHRMSFRLDWEKLLSDRRHGQVPAVASAGAGTRNRFEQDYDRVIFSAPFRRLAGKTQVHPFAALEHVHNRLTHTLEVASVGRSLAQAAGQLLVELDALPNGRSIEDIAYIVQSACLAHDIGNPPFGHAGEYAIRAWAQDHLDEIFPYKDAAPDLRATLDDWRWFEGNAQSFRLVARSDNRDQDYFLFTYASLGALVKYPWPVDDPRTAAKKKLGVFSSEEALFSEVAAELGLVAPQGVVRHPLSYLSEAADDICYRIADFEDAVEMRILPESEVRDIFKRIIGDTPEVSTRPLPALRARSIRRLIEAAVAAFRDDYENILEGRRPWDRDLKSDFPAPIQEALALIKARYEPIFDHRPKVAVELGAHAVLGRILSTYARAVRELAIGRSYDKLGFVHKRCLVLAWHETYLRENEHRDAAWWLGRVMDHVAGMTDAHATQVSREISGA